MTDDEYPLRPGPRLSSVAGLQKAGILESFHFDPISGLVGVVYSSAYLEILRSGFLPLADPGYLAAVLGDDPKAMSLWVGTTAARLAGVGGTDGPRSPMPPRDPESSR